jgi:dimethylargininase
MATLGRPDFEKARRQHANYCAALRAAGATVTPLDADAAHPDATFVEDAAVIIAERAILARPGHPRRRGEAAAMRDALERVFGTVEAIEAPGTLDGGDVCEAGDRVYVGISHRTNAAGAMQLATLLAGYNKTMVAIDIRMIPELLHLKSGLSYLGDGCFVAIDALIPLVEVPAANVIRIARNEAYGANCVRVNETVLVAARHPRLAAALTQAGYRTVALDVSEFRKMDGGLSCLSLRF